MNRAMRSRIILPALLLAALATAPAQAERRRSAQEAEGPHDFAPRQLAQQRISLEQAIAIVQRETGGRVLDARAQGQQYRIKVLTRSGEVRVMYVDAATGAMR
jgi:uncharacterized membrane protein YkoI